MARCKIDLKTHSRRIRMSHEMTREEEITLIKRMSQGDQKTLNELMSKWNYFGKLTRWIEKKNIPRDEASSVANACFFILWRNFQQKEFKLEVKIFAYLIGIAKKKISEYWRKEKKSPPTMNTDNVKENATAEQHRLNEQAIAEYLTLQQCIPQLPPLMQQILQQHSIQGDTLQEMASHLNKPVS